MGVKWCYCLFLLPVTLHLFCRAENVDVCSMPGSSSEVEDALTTFVHYNSILRSGKNAGSFQKYEEVETWQQCVSVCCTVPTCNVTLFINHTCYLVQCRADVDGGCDVTGGSSLNSTMFIVRTPVYDGAVAQTGTRALASAISVTKKAHMVKMCEYGLHQCPQDEECVLRSSSKSRFGKCDCLQGYHRDDQNVCLGATSPAPMPTTSKPNQDSRNASSKTDLPKEIIKLTVSAGESKLLQLPKDSITLSAFAIPNAGQDEEYHYEWTPVVQPDGSEEKARMEGQNSDTLTLSNLIAGVYSLKVKVTAERKFGSALVNVTVLAEKRKNKLPVAVIKPSSQEVKSENSFILDGSGSTDDDGIAAYHWEEVNGPLQEHQIDEDTQTLNLKDMAPGSYVFRLTVTDTDGARNSTLANVTVVKEIDYPPKANAGSDIIIHLPQKSVTLCGNSSTDDRGIASYEWIKMSDSKTVDMTPFSSLQVAQIGVRTICLHLNNLELGDYTFTLKVMDTSGSTDDADVHVYVKPESNHPPTAHTAGRITVAMPTANIVLDGQNSTDDKAVMHYKWSQTGGDNILKLENPDQAIAIATGDIHLGDYQFKLTIMDDEGQTSSDKLTVHIKLNENQAPLAYAGPDQVIALPVNFVILNGSSSSDDRVITSYTWARDSESLAAGDIVSDSDHQPLLQLSNLVAGRYSFTLTVTDGQGLTSSDSVSLLVKNGEDYKHLLELILDTDIYHFTQENKLSIVGQLEVLLHQSAGYLGMTVGVVSIRSDPFRGLLRLSFFVRRRDASVTSGVEVRAYLHDVLTDNKILSYPIESLHTTLCQNNCSGHGLCDQRTMKCRCEPFWMPNLLTAILRYDSNCDWSILYVGIALFGLLVVTAGSATAVVWCCRSKRVVEPRTNRQYSCLWSKTVHGPETAPVTPCRCRAKSKKRHRYSLLQDVDNDGKNGLELLPTSRGKIQNSSVMVSESDPSSEEETLFVNSKPLSGNSRLPNGFPSRTAAARNRLKT